MVTNRIIFFATSVQPNPEEIDYWVDLSDNPYGGSIKYFNGTEWVRLAASGGTPDLSNYYTKTQVNKLLNDKANVNDVDSKVDDEEVKDVIKDIQFNTSNPNDITMVMFKYDGSNKTVSIPVASTSSAGIITSKDFLDFVKQHQLQELHTEMIDTFADIRAKYQKKLIAGLNIEIDQETNVISASGELSAKWDNILDKPDFKPVATSGDYNDLINKLKGSNNISISDDNVIDIKLVGGSLEGSLNDLDQKISAETNRATAAEQSLQGSLNDEIDRATSSETNLSNALAQEVVDRNAAIKVESDRAKNAESVLTNAIATEKDRAESAESTITTNLQNEINRSTQQDTAHTTAINKEVQDRKDAITTEVNDRNAAIKVESDRAKAKEEELDSKITDHTTATNAALALKADKSDTYTKQQVDAKLSGAYKVKGSSTFENLPTADNIVGDVYNITNSFTLNGDHFDAGTNVVWTDEGWDPLSGSFDTTAIESSIQEVDDRLSQEVLDRTTSDTTINQNITSVSNRVTTAEGKLDVIQGDVNTSGSISKALSDAKAYTDSSVTTEKTRAEAAEQKLTSDLSSEVTRAKGAESANATAIQNEITRATGIESALRTDVDSLSTNKVDKVSGKSLSTNDYTTPEKNKLAAIEAEANKYVLPAATTTTLGGIIVGDRLSIDSTGKLVATYTYTLPTASSTVLGGVKTGSNITNTDGTISLTKANVTSALGVDPTTKYVTLDTDQTITGSKTFTVVNINTNNSGLLSNQTTLALGNAGTYKIILSSDELRPTGSYNNKIELGNTASRWKSVAAGYFNSNIATGTAPIQVSSTTLCTNLNADMVDGKNADAFSEKYGHSVQITTSSNIYVKLYTITSVLSNFSSYVQFVIGGRGSNKLCTVKVNLTQSANATFDSVLISYDNIYTGGKIRGYLTDPSTVEIWYISFQQDNIYVATSNIYASGVSVIKNMEKTDYLPTSTRVVAQYDAPEDWYGVQWSETSSNPDCTRIGNMEMHRSLPIQSMMKPFAFQSQLPYKDQFVPLKENFTEAMYGHTNNGEAGQVTSTVNVMVKIPEFWYTDDYSPDTKIHRLKICPHAKPGWNHHKEAFVSAYEAFNFDGKGRLVSMKSVVPTSNFTRTNGRTWARANGFEGESKWNIYTYEEHRAICHLFLVEYATRNSQKAVNTALTLEGFRQGGLGSGCTTGTATINGVQTWSFIPTGSSDSLGSGSGEVTVTIQQTDSSGANTTTITRKCNRYRGIENPFGHVWKHTDDVISVYNGSVRTWYKSMKPDQFSTNKNASYKPLCSSTMVSAGYKTEIKATPTCDFFAMSVSGGSENTYWCDYNWDNTDTTEHCLLIGGHSDSGGWAGLFYLHSDSGVSNSYANLGSRLTYLPWAE